MGSHNSLFDIFLTHLKSNPDKTFVQDETGRHTYGTIYEKIMDVCCQLGNDEGCTYALFLENSHLYIIAFMAINFLNKRCLLVPQMAKKYELQHISKNFDKLIWVTDSKRANLLGEECRVVLIDKIKEKTFPLINKEKTTANKDEFILIQLSSGTTGKSKIICRNNKSLIDEGKSISCTLNLNEQDKIMTGLPLSYSFAFGTAFIAALQSNAELHIYNKLLPLKTVKIILENKISMFLSVPIFYDLIMESFDKKMRVDLSGIRYLISSGAELDKKIQQTFFRKFNKWISSQYGTTETGALFVNLKEKDYSLGTPYKEISFVVNEDTNSLQVTGRAFAIDQDSGVPAYEFNINDEFKSKNNSLNFVKRKENVISIHGEKTGETEVEDIINSLNYVKMAKITCCKNNKMIAKILVNKEIDSESLRRDLKKLTMDYKIPGTLIIKKV